MQRKSFIKEFVKSTTWFYSFLIVTSLFIVTYLVNILTGQVEPGNFWGLTYGTIATILMVAVGLYGVRQRQMKISSKLKVGKSSLWVQFHIYAGLIFCLLMFLHINFTFPNGALNWTIWIVTIWVTLSGLLGVFLQKWIPRLLSSALTIEVRYDRITDLVNELKEKSENEASTAAAPIKEFYYRTIAPEMQKPTFRWAHFRDITGGNLARIRQIDYLRSRLADSDRASLDKIEQHYLTKLECDAHYTLQKPLRVWLVLHLPISIVLFVLIAIHLYVVYYY